MKRFVALLMVFLMMTNCLPSALAATQTRSTDESIRRYSVLVVDTSDSAEFMSGHISIYKADSALKYVKKAANSFLDDLVNAPGENHVAVVSFSDLAWVRSGFTTDVESVKSEVRKLDARGSVRSISEGLDVAYSLIEGINDPGAIKNVILVTTGMTNGGQYNYDGKYDETVVGNGWYRMDTFVNLYAYANSALEAADRVKSQATLYVLGLFQTMEGMPSEGRDIAELFRLTASDLATSQDTFFDVEDPDNIDFAFGEIADDILSGYDVIHGSFKYRGDVESKRLADPDDGCDSESDYYYTDGYFFTNSSEANPSLATMSLALELSAFSSFEQDNWYDPSLASSSEAFYEDRLANVKTLLLGNPFAAPPKYSTENGFNGIGFSNFDANEFWEADPLKDSIGVCAATKEIKSPKNEPYTLVAVVVRGGGYGSEWASNFTLGSSGDHEGFATARDNVIEWLNDYLEKQGLTSSDHLKLWIVGYSRAGITANMVAGAIDANNDTIQYGNVAPENIYCYTFEAPQGIVERHNGGVYSNIHNYRNLNDLVPMVAPEVWDFTRYNKKYDVIFPNAYTNGRSYASYHNDMKQQLRDMHFDDFENNTGVFGESEMGYSIRNTIYVKDFKIDKSKFLPFGDPLWWFEEREADTTSLLHDGVSYLFDDVVRSRKTYAYRMEDTVRLVAGILKHYDGALAGISAEVASGIKTRFDFDHFIECVGDLFTLDNLTYIFGPMVEINIFYSFDERIEDVEERAKAVISKCFADYSVIFTATQFDSFLDALCEVLVEALLDIAGDLWDNDTSDINTFASLVSVFQTMGFQGHFPEVTLAWVRSLDPNYNDAAKEPSKNTTTRIIRINCPVDVYVYDSDGVLCASFKNGQASSGEEELVHYVSIQDEKVLFLPGDTDYTIEVKARDEGDVNVSLSEHNFTYGHVTRLMNYYNINVQNNDDILVTVPAISEKEQEENSADGSTAFYRLTHNGKTVDCTEEFRGEQVTPKEHRVALTTEGNGGYVDGAGDFLQGSFAKVEAFTLPGGAFLGWYQDGNLVSEEMVYRFAVREDTTLIARFTDVDFHHLQVKAADGGTVAETDSYFTANMEIGLLATPQAGGSFAGWTVEGAGKVKNASMMETTFIMGDGDAVVTAHFKHLPSVIGFDANGGVVNVHTLQTVDGKLPYLPEATRTGYVFEGWYTAPEGGERVTTETVFHSASTVYAHWIKELPLTGDDSNMIMWIMMMGISSLLLVGMARKREESRSL